MVNIVRKIDTEMYTTRYTKLISHIFLWRTSLCFIIPGVRKNKAMNKSVSVYSPKDRSFSMTTSLLTRMSVASVEKRIGVNEKV